VLQQAQVNVARIAAIHLVGDGGYQIQPLGGVSIRRFGVRPAAQIGDGANPAAVIAANRVEQQACQYGGGQTGILLGLPHLCPLSTTAR